MRVTSPPPLAFKCTGCGARNEGEENEFRPRNTTPPTWVAKCGYCHLDNVVAPTALISKHVGLLSDSEVFAAVRERAARISGA